MPDVCRWLGISQQTDYRWRTGHRRAGLVAAGFRLLPRAFNCRHCRPRFAGEGAKPDQADAVFCSVARKPYPDPFCGAGVELAKYQLAGPSGTTQ